MPRLVSGKLLSLLLLASLAGCRGPTELFSFIDRNCFVADWMNDHSCVSCRYAANCSTGPTLPLHPRTLELPSGDPTTNPEPPAESAANVDAR